MAQSIVLVGGLSNDPLYNEIITQLRGAAGSAIEWDWIRADASSGYRPPEKYMRGLLTKLAQAVKETPTVSQISVVKLSLLNGTTANVLHTYCDPTQVPSRLQSFEEVLPWLLSDEANLIPKREWFGNRREAALAAILSKLIRNKSWNKDTQGHAWTKEADLLGQSPVFRKDYQMIGVEASRMLGRLDKTLLLCKGGTPGTPKEWCIRLAYLSVVKQIIIQQSFAPLEQLTELTSLRKQLEGSDERCHRIDSEIVNERVRAICRVTH